MRALVIGRGSMGRRRIRDLTALGVEVESWDITDGGPSPLDTCPTGPDFPWQGVVLSTPPLTKAHDLYRLLPAFTEADVETWREPHFPSCTPLFTDWYAEFSRDPAMKQVRAYTLHVGQHLDDWHPGADSAAYYAYQGDTAVREMVPFELIWLTKLFGPVTSSQSFVQNRVAAVLGNHGPVEGDILIDTLSRPPIRRFTLIADGWQKSFDLTYSEDTYLREMRAFVESVEGGKPWPYTLAEERANLEVLHTIERFA